MDSDTIKKIEDSVLKFAQNTAENSKGVYSIEKSDPSKSSFNLAEIDSTKDFLMLIDPSSKLPSILLLNHLEKIKGSEITCLCIKDKIARGKTAKLTELT